MSEDQERMDWLEDFFSTTSEESKVWHEFYSLVAEKGFRRAIDQTRSAEAARAKAADGK